MVHVACPYALSLPPPLPGPCPATNPPDLNRPPPPPLRPPPPPPPPTPQFPDPHFKRKHRKRRVVQAQLVAALAALMRPGGRILLQSDVEEVGANTFFCRDCFLYLLPSFFCLSPSLPGQRAAPLGAATLFSCKGGACSCLPQCLLLRCALACQ